MPEFILVRKMSEGAVAHIQLNRPEALNALNPKMMSELGESLRQMDDDDSIKVVVISGNEKVFAAGADIKQMADKNAVEMYMADQLDPLDSIRKMKKPVIAAVNGFALGGGCELAMLCDMIIASETAQFGQPEIKIGVIPGAGGTQRLTRAVGKALAMEMILTGRFISAEEAFRAGLVNKVVPEGSCLEEALELARQIAAMPPLAVRMAKEAVLKAFEMPLEEGLQFERKNFYFLFATQDQKEGMKAFMEKRKALFKGE
jgi:enoyl-CoA hydratase